MCKRRICLNNAEAVTVLREIYTAIPEFGFSAGFKSIDPNNAKISQGLTGFYELRLKVHVNTKLREAINPILRSHKLDMTVTKGLLVIF